MAGFFCVGNSIWLKLLQRAGLIGSGGFGKVYLGMNLDTGELIAVKQIPVDQTNSTRREVTNLFILFIN